jgi:hypothetical protein
MFEPAHQSSNCFITMSKSIGVLTSQHCSLNLKKITKDIRAIWLNSSRYWTSEDEELHIMNSHSYGEAISYYSILLTVESHL